METKYAISKAGSAAKLARILGVTRGAVSQYGEMLPQPRVWQLMLLHPEWFKAYDKEKATE